MGHVGRKLQVIFHITEPVLERNPYKKSTVPVWAEAQTEMPRPMEAPLIPNKANLCGLVKGFKPPRAAIEIMNPQRCDFLNHLFCSKC